MGKIMAVHSYKGGTGKTLLSINLAAALAKTGKKVCLFDLDFRAPSLATLLKVKNPNCWLNDYLNGSCEIEKALVDISERIGNSGKLCVALANPNTEAIREMSSKDRKWEMRALGRLLALRNLISNTGNFDYLVFDTSPGLQYSSINAIVAADLVVVATTFDRSDMEGTQRMLRELYDLFEKKTYLVLNKVLENPTRHKSDLQATVKDFYQVPLLGVVPCYCDILKAEGSTIFAQDKPDHPFTRMLNALAAEIEKNIA
ncbi:MinD/ParA family protein [Candidatus Bathyarchaeota archaeon]|nr:MinD/ParA family protein [Candidatus Bathyarchaeota archaeon]